MLKLNRILFAAMFAFSMNAYAFIAKDSPTDKLIFCPESISCKKKPVGDGYTCDLFGGSDGYWSHDVSGSNGRWDVIQGKGQIPEGQIFKLNIALSSHFHSYPGAVCEYLIKLGDYKQVIDLHSKPGANLELVNVTRTPSPGGKKEHDKCNDALERGTNACPFYEKPVLGFDSCYISSDRDNCAIGTAINVTFFANNIPINYDTTDYFGGPESATAWAVRYEDVLPACGSVKQCKVDVVWVPKGQSKLEAKASVMLDLTNNMRIINITPETLPEEASIKKQEPYNSIMLQTNEKSGAAKKSVYCPETINIRRGEKMDNSFLYYGICELHGETPEYWIPKVEDFSDAYVTPDVPFYFMAAVASYDDKENISDIECIYDDRRQNGIRAKYRIHNKPNIPVAASTNKKSGWFFRQKKAVCPYSNVKICAFWEI